jgi:2-haloacid dehalogenase
MSNVKAPEIVVFDVGNVLVDWDPRYLYRKIFADAGEMERFLGEVCHPEWNLAQDAGRPWPVAEAEAIARHPEAAAHIKTYRARWHEMIAGPIAGGVALLEALAAAGVPLYAITNFAADTFAETRAKYAFFRHFRGIVISGEIGIIKPDARIYERLASDFGVDLSRTVFIDDSLKNCAGARACGMRAVHFANAEQVRGALREMGLGV